MSKRNYPDINVVDTNPETLTNILIKAYEIFTKRTLQKADPTRLFILWIADIITQERVIINNTAKQNVPRYAKGEFLDSIAEIFRDVYRLEAEAATTTLRFYISKALTTQQLVPQGTRVTVDGDIIFQTVEALYIKAGETYGDVTAICQIAGDSGNGFVPGQISQLIDVFPFYQKVENITESAGGAERETDDAFYERMRESMESYSTAGSKSSYVYHAKTASPLITDVSVLTPDPNVVDIKILLQNGELPGEEIIKKVQEAVSAEKVRPITDLVRVSGADKVNYSIDFTYYIAKSNASSASTIIQDIKNAVDDYKAWQSAKMGRDINPSYLSFLIMKAGAKRVIIRSPVYVIVDDDKVAILQNTNIVDGGLEDE